MLHINKQMLHQLTFPPCFRERIFCRAAWRLWQTLITGVLLSWIQTSDYRYSKKKKKKERLSESIFQPYVKHRPSPPRQKTLQFFKCHRGSSACEINSVPVWKWQLSVTVGGGEMWLCNINPRPLGGNVTFKTAGGENGGSSFFDSCHLGRDGSHASVWPRDRGWRWRTMSLPDMIDTI